MILTYVNCFTVVDCPSIHYLDSLQNSEEFLKHQSSAVCDEDLAYFIVHFTPPDVMEHSRYNAYCGMYNPVKYLHIVIIIDIESGLISFLLVHNI